MSHLHVVSTGTNRAQQTRAAFMVIGGVVAFGCLAAILIGLFLFPEFRRDPGQEKRKVTTTNLLYIGQAFRAYAAEHEGRLPSKDKWRTDITPYLANDRVLTPPGEGVSYAFNDSISGSELRKAEGPPPEILVFESLSTTSGDPATAYEREGKFVVLLADGTVESYSPAEFRSRR